MSQPPASIIIPAYNAEKTLAVTCASVAGQNYTDWECIIVDDGSTDGTRSVALELSANDTRFRYIHQENQGVSAARNRGIQNSRGGLLAFLDADDLWLPHTLAALVAPFRKNLGLDFTWGTSERFSENGEIKPIMWKNYHSTGIPWYDILVHDFLPMGSFCVCRKALPPPPYFDASFTHGEDRDFLLRVLKDAATAAVGETVLLIRLRTNSASANAGQAIESELRSMQKYFQDPDIPPAVLRRAQSSLAFRCAVIAGFTGRDWHCALRWYLRAVFRDPFNYNNYLLVLRKLWMTIFPSAPRFMGSVYGNSNE
ncbi:glycosyltransferase family 2 protein [Desulfocurvibacter africanus]|uniref:glycosyltransferase family 2 protein n=1 Tax=Desulfocurvibacter africanus TaxID=873 RepID=UPI002FD8A373